MVCSCLRKRTSHLPTCGISIDRESEAVTWGGRTRCDRAHSSEIGLRLPRHAPPRGMILPTAGGRLALGRPGPFAPSHGRRFGDLLERATRRALIARQHRGIFLPDLFANSFQRRSTMTL